MAVYEKKALAALFIQLCVIIVFGLTAYAFEATDQDHSCTFSLANYFHFGPSEELCFISVRIDTWWKWAIFLALSMLIDGTSTMGRELVSPWVSNVLAGPNGPPPSSCLAHSIQQLYYINYYLESAIGTFVALTQVDLLVFSMIASCVVTFYTTGRYLKAKEGKNTPLLVN
jgi:hypothetical protein